MAFSSEFEVLIINADSIFQYLKSKLIELRCTGYVDSSGPPFKDGSVLFTTVPLNPLSDHVYSKYAFFCLFKLVI